jgi:hypothetical protein
LRFFGPTIGFDYFAGEGTTYGGLKRALGVSGGATLYPAGLSSYTVLDTRVGLTTAVPLPLLLRHSLGLALDARALTGAPRGALQVGGLPRGYDLIATNTDRGSVGGPTGVPEFSVGVRGYEDHSVRANHAVVFAARYRYPFIIDRGFASLVYVFPSLFFRQVDIDLWGVAAMTDNEAHPWLRAAGAQVSVRLAFGGALGVSFYYQFAGRFDEHLGPRHSVGLTFE